MLYRYGDGDDDLLFRWAEADKAAAASLACVLSLDETRHGQHKTRRSCLIARKTWSLVDLRESRAGSRVNAVNTVERPAQT